MTLRGHQHQLSNSFCDHKYAGVNNMLCADIIIRLFDKCHWSSQLCNGICLGKLIVSGWWQKVNVEWQHFTQMSDNQRQWETEWIIWSQLDIDLKSNITLFWSNRCTQTLSLFSYLSSASYLIYIVWCSLGELLGQVPEPTNLSFISIWLDVRDNGPTLLQWCSCPNVDL